MADKEENKEEPKYDAVRASGLSSEDPKVTMESSPSAEQEDVTAVYRKDVYRIAVQKARGLLLTAAGVTFLFALGEFVGAIFARSLCLIVNSTAYLIIFSRLMFLAFLIYSAGNPTTDLYSLRKHKPELQLVTVTLLLGWLVLGGGLALGIYDHVNETFSEKNVTAYIITSAVGLLYAILMIMMMTGGNRLTVVDKRKERSQAIETFRASLDEYSRERGQLLRETLKKVPMRPYLFMTLWFAVQCALALASALVYTLIPDDVPPYLDLILAYAFIPLSIISSVLLVVDIINILTEGILQGLESTEVAESLLAIRGVTNVRDLCIWALAVDEVSLSVRLDLKRGVREDTIINKASALLKAKYNVFEYNIDTERENKGASSSS